ncbi:MAG: hypothetical protein K940chlam5_01231 [Candidatus Anoxychlamydiales bacterium]|nr:hypothetical protein [Candidatus Anoxychlamydiales bacterium]
MIKFFRKTINKGFFVYLMLIAFFFFNGCASYKAEPLEDFTETNDSRYNNQENIKSDSQ